jgi:hypothetical protein
MSSPILEQLSVRAQTWLGARLIRQFCASNGIEDHRISQFCQYLEELPQCTNIPAWDTKGSSLEVSGLESLPKDLKNIEGLSELLELVHEISASQIYGAWQPQIGTSFLRKAAKLAGINIQQTALLRNLSEHEPATDGWGEPVTSDLLKRWQNAIKPITQLD